MDSVCYFMRVKFTDLVLTHICIQYQTYACILIGGRNLCYSYTHLRVFCKQKAVTNMGLKNATLNVHKKKKKNLKADKH